MSVPALFHCDWRYSRGRIFDEITDTSKKWQRSPFQKDRDRIIHSTAFRRLGHKTQVFVSPKGDHIRTRLTHSIEVAQIARTLANALLVDVDLTEAIALAHDLGHPPFGHSGEDKLADLMQPFGGFDHNDHALRILTELEMRYPNFEGLNLSIETLEGVVKHNGPITTPIDELPSCLKNMQQKIDLRLGQYASIEAQIAGIADDIAYNHHDMDDGLKAGLFPLDDLLDAVPKVKEKYDLLLKEHSDIKPTIMINSLVRELIGDMVMDVLKISLSNLVKLAKTHKIDQVSYEMILAHDAPIIALSDEFKETEKQMKGFLMQHMYRAPEVIEEREKGQETIAQLFEYYMQNPHKMPDDWQQENLDKQAIARLVCDYIAGMTDRFALDLVKNW